MKQILLFTLLLTLLSSCASNLSYDVEKNCSTNALEHRHHTSKTTKEDDTFYRSKVNDIKEFYLNILTPQFKECYQSYLDTVPNHREFAICTETIVQDGKVIFVDVDDRVNSLNSELKACMESRIQKANWSFLKRKSPVSINQPVLTHAIRN